MRSRKVGFSVIGLRQSDMRANPAIRPPSLLLQLPSLHIFIETCEGFRPLGSDCGTI